VLNKSNSRFSALEIASDIYVKGVVVTTDTSFANEANMGYLHSQGINGYNPDNLFRQRDPRFSQQRVTRPKPSTKNTRMTIKEIHSSYFVFDPVAFSCRCPAGNLLRYRGTREDVQGNLKAYFEGKISQCRHCKIKPRCMRNPDSMNRPEGKDPHRLDEASGGQP